MNTSAIKYLVFVLLFGLGLSSCTDKIELDLPEGEQFLVVQGWITNEPGPQVIELTYPSAYFSDAPQPRVQGATCIVSDDAGSEVVLDEVSPGVYHYPDAGVIGRTYRLSISLPNGDSYLSDPEFLFEPVPIDTIYWQLSEDEPDPDNDEQPDDIYDVLIETVEPPSLGDHYQWRSILNGVEQRDPFDIFAVSDEFVNGNPIPEFNVTDELYSTPDTVTIIQERISKKAYEFLTLVQLQTAFVGGPFDTPPAPIESNVRNLADPEKDALGFFGAAARDRATVVVGVD
jgi:hypothetical protein